MFYSTKLIVGERNLLELAHEIHRAYVTAAEANSYQRENPHSFSITEIIATEKGLFKVLISQESNLYETEPMTGEQIINTLIGGRFKVTVDNLDYKFNTKEAFVDQRIENGLTALNLLSDAGYIITDLAKESQNLSDKIIKATIENNSKAIQTTYWLATLKLQQHIAVDINDADLIHILWCMFVNYDNESHFLYNPFPLTDDKAFKLDEVIATKAASYLNVVLNFDTRRINREDLLTVIPVICGLFNSDMQMEPLITSANVEQLIQYFMARFDHDSEIAPELIENLNMVKDKINILVTNKAQTENFSYTTSGDAFFASQIPKLAPSKSEVKDQPEKELQIRSGL